jgi:hypothetical protein
MPTPAALPLLAPSPSETLAERCARFALQIADYERDITDQSPLELSAIRETLESASVELSEADRLLTELGS